MSRGDRFAVVRIRFELPRDAPLYELTRNHPDLVINVLNTQPLSPTQIMTELDVVGAPQVDFTPEIRGTPGILSVTRTAGRGNRARYRVECLPPSYLRFTFDMDVLLRYPRIVQNGEYTVEVAARVSVLKELLAHLRAMSPNVQMLRFGEDTMHTCPSTLTPREYALLHQALAAGHFDVPRRITLTRLAARLGRSKSSVSRALALVEKKLAEASVAASG